ncbi:MAG: hypothetical protein JXR79_03515 [Nitrospirae bacterium]|nr:hypothetical protein [Nitrospirota bacterium]
MFKKGLKTLILLSAAVLLIYGCVPPQSVNQTSNTRQAASTSLKLWYEGTYGKAGHHMVAQPKGSCPVTWNANNPTLLSTLPPGLKLNAFNIEGTPEQPGRWISKVRFTGLSCQGKSYPDQTVTINFNIEGDAPRKIK